MAYSSHTKKKPKFYAIERHGHEAYISYCQGMFEAHGAPFFNPYDARQEDLLARAKDYYERLGIRWNDWDRRERIREEYAAWRRGTLPYLKQEWDDELLRALSHSVARSGYTRTLNINAIGKKHASVAKVMAAIIRLAKGNGRLFASNRTIAKWAGTGLTNTKECVALLESCGAIKRVHSGGLEIFKDGTFKTRSNVYLVSYQQFRRIAGVPLNGYSRFELADLFCHQISGEQRLLNPGDAAYWFIAPMVVFRRMYGHRSRDNHPFFDKGVVRHKGSRNLKALIRQNFHSKTEGHELLVSSSVGFSDGEHRCWDSYYSLLSKCHDLRKRKVINKVPTTNKQSLFVRINNHPPRPSLRWKTLDPRYQVDTETRIHAPSQTPFPLRA